MSREIPKFTEYTGKTRYTISYIVPFMYTEDRYPLLLKTIENLPNGKYDEICLVEIGKTQNFSISNLSNANLSKNKNLKYEFFYYNSDIMHRGWALNLGAKQMATGDLLVLLDADIIVTDTWKRTVRRIPKYPPVIGWSKLYYLDSSATNEFINKGRLTRGIEKVKNPTIIGAAGGCTIVSNEIFHEVKGIPENFEGTWGGPDNTFLSKLNALGYPLQKLGVSIYHLYHNQKTPRKQQVRDIAKPMLDFTKEDWLEELEYVGDDWGEFGNSKLNSTVLNDRIEEKYGKQRKNTNKRKSQVNNQSGTNKKLNKDDTLYEKIYRDTSQVTLAMVSWYRVDKLISSLTNLYNITNGNINLCLNVQGKELLSQESIDKIRHFNELFKSSHIYFTQGNVGTGKPRYETTKLASSEFSNTKYTLIVDDDMSLPKNSIEKLMYALETNPFLGACSLWCTPNFNAWYIRDNTLEKRKPIPDIDYTMAMGSGTMMIKNEVFTKAEFDPNYQIGFVDFDFCMSMKNSGWDLAILALNKFSGHNDSSNNDQIYKQQRSNSSTIKKNYMYFKDKWGLKISDGEKFIQGKK